MLISLRYRRLCSLLIVLALIGGHAAAMGGSRSESASVAIDIEDGLLTLEARDAPLSEIVQAIGERAGFETFVLGAHDHRVDLSFSQLPLVMALERVLGDSNRVIVYTAGEKGIAERRIARLWLLATSAAVSEPPGGETQEAANGDYLNAGTKERSKAMLRLGVGPATEAEVAALAQALHNDEEALVRTRAALALGALADERAVPALEAALLDENSSVRIQAIHALSKIGGERAISALGDVLLHSEESLPRVVAARSLASQDDPAARQYLQAVADDPDAQVRDASKSPPPRSRAAPSQRRSLADQVGTGISK